MTTPKKQPGVETIQRNRTTTPTIRTSLFTPCIIGPLYEIIEVTNSDGTLNADAKYGAYAQRAAVIDQLSFPSPRNNIDEVDVLEDSIEVFFYSNMILSELLRDPGEGFLASWNKATRAGFVFGAPFSGSGTSATLPLDGTSLVFSLDNTVPANHSDDYVVVFESSSSSTSTVTLQEAIDAINETVGSEVADYYVSGSGYYLRISSLTWGALSSVTIRSGATANSILGCCYSGMTRRVEGAGFKGEDDLDGDTLTPWIIFSKGHNYADIVETFDSESEVAPGSLWKKEDHVDAYTGAVLAEVDAEDYQFGGTAMWYNSDGEWVRAYESDISFVTGLAGAIPLKVGDQFFADGSLPVVGAEVLKVESSRFKLGTVDPSLSVFDNRGRPISKVMNPVEVPTFFSNNPFAPRYGWFMAQGLNYTKTSPVNTPAAICGSVDGTAATKAIISGTAMSPSMGSLYSLNGLNLRVTATVDGVEGDEQVFTFSTGMLDSMEEVVDTFNAGGLTDIVASVGEGESAIVTSNDLSSFPDLSSKTLKISFTDEYYKTYASDDPTWTEVEVSLPAGISGWSVSDLVSYLNNFSTTESIVPNVYAYESSDKLVLATKDKSEIMGIKVDITAGSAGAEMFTSSNNEAGGKSSFTLSTIKKGSEQEISLGYTGDNLANASLGFSTTAPTTDTGSDILFEGKKAIIPPSGNFDKGVFSSLTLDSGVIDTTGTDATGDYIKIAGAQFDSISEGDFATSSIAVTTGTKVVLFHTSSTGAVADATDYKFYVTGGDIADISDADEFVIVEDSPRLMVMYDEQGGSSPEYYEFDFVLTYFKSDFSLNDDDGLASKMEDISSVVTELNASKNWRTASFSTTFSVDGGSTPTISSKFDFALVSGTAFNIELRTIEEGWRYRIKLVHNTGNLAYSTFSYDGSSYTGIKIPVNYQVVGGTDLVNTSLKFTLNDNPKVYEVNFISNSMADAIESINEEVGETVAMVGSYILPPIPGARDTQLGLTSSLHGVASSISITYDEDKLISGSTDYEKSVKALGFSDYSGSLSGSGRPDPDLFISADGSVVLNSELIREQVSGLPVADATGDIYIQYKGLRRDVSPEAENPGLLRITDVDDIENDYGPISSNNPLALGLYFAKLGCTNYQVYGVGVDEVSGAQPEGTSVAYTKALEFTEGNKEIWSIAPLTYDSLVQQYTKTHVENMTAPSSRTERIAWISPLAPTREADTPLLSGTDASKVSGQTNQLLLDSTSNPVGALTAAGIDKDDLANEDVYVELEVSTASGQEVRNYKVSVVNGVILQLTTTFSDSENLDGFYTTTPLTETIINADWSMKEKGASLTVPGSNPPRLDKDRFAEAVAAGGESFQSSLVRAVFPDEFGSSPTGTEELLPGYFVAAYYAGLTGNTPPQQPLTNWPIAGFTSAPKAGSLNDDQLDMIAGGGVFIVHQPSDGAALSSRHQLTTDVDTLESQEHSIIAAIHAARRRFRNAVKNLIGSNNITDGLLNEISLAVQSEIGRMVEEGMLAAADLNNVIVDDNNRDTILIDVTLELLYPCNYIRITVVV